MIFQPGDIVFVMHNNNKISKLIAWFMRSKWSHSALVFEHCEILDKDLLIETSDFQVGVNNLDRYIADPKVSMEVRRAPGGLNPEQAKRIVNKGYDLNEVMFGYDQLFSTGIKLLLLRWKFKIKNFFRSGVMCCHVIFYAYQGEGFQNDVSDPEEYNTQELYEMTSSFELVFKKEVK